VVPCYITRPAIANERLTLDRAGDVVAGQERFSERLPLCEPADAVERMRHRLKTRAGRASYGKRKQNRGAGLRHHQSGDAIPAMRGLEAVRGERSLVTNGVEHPSDGGSQKVKTRIGSVRSPSPSLPHP
jgi:hypothetical protein